MPIQLRKAERAQSKLRIGLSGPAGSGKTYSALLLANGLAPWEKIVLIDTENGSGELYSNLGPYNVITLEADFTPEKYIEAIRAAEDAGMEVIVIDSTSHEWDGKGGCLEINERLASAKFKGNTWAAWSETTPRHQKFIQAIVQSDCHIITTQRSKTDMIQTEDKKIKKVGMKEIQREGFEYELTTNFALDRDGHYAIASKDRTGIFIHRDPFVIDRSIGEEFLNWCKGGTAKQQEPSNREKRLQEKKVRVFQQLKMLGYTITKDTPKEEVDTKIKELTQLELNDENLEEVSSRLHIILQERKDAGNPPVEVKNTTGAQS